MNLTDSILTNIRSALGLSPTASDFDDEVLMHINAAIGTLNQNGIGKEVIIVDDTTTWGDLQDPTQAESNGSFKMVPLFIKLSTKLLFDPPPPSSTEFHQSYINELLWRLKVAYEEPHTTTTTTLC